MGKRGKRGKSGKNWVNLQIKYANIIEFLDAYVNNIRNDYERFKERNGPTNIYDDKQLKLLNVMKQQLKMLHH